MVQDTWISFIIGCFVSYFLATLIAVEYGPFDFFINLRSKIHERYGSSHWLSHGVTCPKCVGFYTSFVVSVALILVMGWSWTAFPWLWLGMSGVVRFLYVWAN